MMRGAVPAAVVLMLAGSGWSAPAMASDLGCEVLLCLSNPGGPMQYGACVQPIKTLWSDLARGEPFPSCGEDGVVSTKTKGKRDTPSYRVIMTYTDGSQESYSLAGISSRSALFDTVAPIPGANRQ
jgi:hypothetical protein